uniref:Metallophosphoesterase domain containing 1-like protein n=1 Tax=Philodina roseola TaxID=96448 RepID=B6S312_PHIRO|nr:metallophosphoesterase domain containing 1-like protein [Philodina roseola]
MSTTRFVCVSDTHSSYEFSLPDGDILLHGGDFSRSGKSEEIETFLQWLKSLKQYRLKIIIAGNHDITLDEEYYQRTWNRFHHKKYDSAAIQRMFRDPKLKENYGIIYLQDESFVDPVTKLKFYGSPWQPEFCAWAFNVKHDSPQMRQIWNEIPDDTDILLTHGPPYGILDETSRKENVGCRVLRERLEKLRVKLHVFGHIHEAYGKESDRLSSTIFVNASTCDLRYKPVQPPIVVTI